MDNYILLGLNRKDYKIMKIEETNGIIKVELKSNKSKVRCTNCNKFTYSIHDRLKPIKSIYLDSCGRKVVLIIYKRRFHCYNCNKIFTENMNLNTFNGNISNKVKIQIRKDLLDYNMTIDKISEKNHVSKSVVRKELENATNNIPEYTKNLPSVISFDEFKADTNEGKYAFIFTNPIKKEVLGILPNRKKEYLVKYFMNTQNRHSVKFVISDMYEPYLQVQKIMFSKAKYVVDKFHYIRYIMDAIDGVRIRIQKNYNEKSKEYKILKNKKNVGLLRKYGNEINWWVETQRYKNNHMVLILPKEILDEIFNISDEIRRAYQLKELFLDIINHATYNDAKEQLLNWIDLCYESEIEEFKSAANTINNWLEYIVNSFIDERYTNGFTEGINNKIKVIKRNAFGYRNFEFLRRRLLYIFNNKLNGGTGNNINKKS